MLAPEAAEALTKQAHEAYRTQHDLLTPTEIIGLRNRLGMSQAELGRLLHLGNNTISRWERSRKVQSVSMDALLRLLRDVPGAILHLQKRAA
jgi:putative zinc finger/helix-turn-helix YgiT family protein